MPIKNPNKPDSQHNKIICFRFLRTFWQGRREIRKTMVGYALSMDEAT